MAAINVNSGYIDHLEMMIGFRWGPIRVGTELLITKLKNYGGSKDNV